MERVPILEYAFVAFCCVGFVLVAIDTIKRHREYRAAYREFNRLLVENADSLRALREQIMLDGVATFDERASGPDTFRLPPFDVAAKAAALPERFHPASEQPVRSDVTQYG